MDKVSVWGKRLERPSGREKGEMKRYEEKERSCGGTGGLGDYSRVFFAGTVTRTQTEAFWWQL